MRASSVVKLHFTLAPAQFRWAVHALASRLRVAMSGNRPLRQCLAKTETSISTIFSNEPCTGV